MFRQVTFTGDFLRPSPYYWRPTQHFNALWLKQLLSEAIRQATGLASDMVTWGHSSVTGGRLDSSFVGQVYSEFGVKRNIDGWAEIYDSSTCPAAVECLLVDYFRDSLVIGFELPPYLEAILNRNGIPFIDIINHPVRFLDDIMFGLRSNLAHIGEVLPQYAVTDNWLRLMASVQSASAQRLFDFTPDPDSALFLMQVQHDKSQIRNGKFVGAMDFMHDVAEIAAEHSTVYIKEHPSQPQSPHTMAIRYNFPNVRTIDANFYSLVATREIRTVAALSSSTVVEAQYFGKSARFVFQPPYQLWAHEELATTASYVGVFDEFLNPDFWRGILRGVMPVTENDGMKVFPKPNRLRLSLREFWNFNEIDTDFAVHSFLRKRKK